MRIDQERINKMVKDLGEKYLKRFVKDIHIFGGENLKKLKDKSVLYLPNHLSHFDYIAIPKILNNFELKHPFIIAGSNLNHWPTNKLFSEETGAIFINRKVMEGDRINKRKKEEIIQLNSALEELILNGENLINFIESGRSYNKKIMERGSSGILRRYLKISKKFEKEPYGCNIAIKYEPNTIESPCLKVTSFFKNKVEAIYLFTDLYAFGKDYFFGGENRPIVKINFGAPYPLKEFTGKKGHSKLLKFVQEDVKRLYKKIS